MNKFDKLYTSIINEETTDDYRACTPEEEQWFKSNGFYGCFDPNNNPKGYFGIFKEFEEGKEINSDQLYAVIRNGQWIIGTRLSGKKARYIGSKDIHGTGSTPEEAYADFIKKESETIDYILQKINDEKNKFEAYKASLNN